MQKYLLGLDAGNTVIKAVVLIFRDGSSPMQVKKDVAACRIPVTSSVTLASSGPTPRGLFGLASIRRG